MSESQRKWQVGSGRVSNRALEERFFTIYFNCVAVVYVQKEEFPIEAQGCPLLILAP